MIGFIEYLGRRFFAPRYFGRQYFDLPVPVDLAHRVFVLPADRLVNVLADVAALPAPNRLVRVAPANRLMRAED